MLFLMYLSDSGRYKNELDPRPPKAGVTGSNPVGRAIFFKALRESVGPFYLAVPKLGPWCVHRKNKE